MSGVFRVVQMLISESDFAEYGDRTPATEARQPRAALLESRPARSELCSKFHAALIGPFFFVMTGTKIDLSQLSATDALLALALAVLVAVASKLLGGFLGALTLGNRGALIVGIGMVPRGEVGVVVANLGLAADVFSDGSMHS